MKSITTPAACLAIGLLLIFSAAAGCASPEKRERVLQYFQSVGLMESIDAQIEAELANFRARYVELHDTFWSHQKSERLINAYRQRLLDSYVEVVVSQVSDEELDFLVRFYDSEDGQKSLAIARRLQSSLAGVGAVASSDFAKSFSEWIEADEY